jgi:hypothetical protein
MTALDLDIYGSQESLAEIEKLLREAGVTTKRSMLIANTIGAGAEEILLVVAGAAIPLVAQALTAYIRGRSGQRKIVVQWLDDKDECLKRVEVETPRLAEIEELLKKAEGVVAVDREDKET